MWTPKRSRMLLGSAGILLAAGAALAGEGPPTTVPGFINGEILVNEYPSGGGNDLLTGGLGAAGLQRPPSGPPEVYPPVSIPPTAEELRTIAIYNNYRALVDTTSDGGYGRLYGPLVGPTTADGEGKIYGVEYLAYAKGQGGDQNVTLMVQIPEAFDPARACVVTGPSSGSRGIYGAIGTSGEWGLKKGCAVAYTDKGTGTGAHNLERDTVSLLRGERVPADEAGDRSNFTAPISDAERLAFNARHPDRWAWKHAHSELNPEADWDRHVLLSLEFALWALHDRYGRDGGARLDWDDMLVIASSVSNGGGASLRAAEIAPNGVIDAVVVSEPNVNPVYEPRLVIQQGDGERLRRHSRPLYDYLTLIDLYQGCANLAPENAGAPLNLTPPVLGQNRCAALAQAGLLEGSDLPGQAQAIINRYGILEAQNVLAPSYWAFYVVQAVAVTYADAYARASVLDNLCGFSFAATDAASNQVIELPPASEAVLFATANGIPPTGGVNVVNDRSPGAPLRDQVSLSPSPGLADQNLDGHLCLRSLTPGPLPSDPPLVAERRFRRQARESIRQILADGELGGIPTILVHGRSDALLAPNHTSRPYYALSRLQDGGKSRIAYYEVTNAQHLDAFNALFPAYAERFVPLHYYFIQALDLMWEHLTGDAELPRSQVVRTVPRGTLEDGSVPPLEAANVPPIADQPARADRITFDGRVLHVPE